MMVKATLRQLADRFKKQPAAAVPRLIDDPELVFRGNPNYPEHDHNGFRNIGVPNKVDILVVGDSQVYGITVPREKSWPAVLGQKMGLKVYNASIGGWGVPQFSRVMQQQLSMNPRHVLIGIYTGQSIYKSLIYILKSQSAFARGYWRPEYEQIPLVDFTYNVEKHEAIQVILKHNPQLSRAEALLQCAAKGLLDCNLAEIGPSRFFLEDTYRFLIANLQHPAIQAAMAISKQALIQIRDTAQTAGANLSVVLIPTKEYVVYLRRQDASVAEPNTLENLGKNEDRLLAELIHFCDAQGIRCLNVASQLAQYITDRVYWQDSDDGHPTPSGCEHIANCLTEWLH